MGKTSDSFKREIGKNTGKAVSNFFFGDSHATPVKLIRDVKREGLEEKYRLENELLEKKAKAELKQVENQNFLEFKKDIDTKIMYTLNYAIPEKEEELSQFLNEVKTNLYINNWSLFLSTSVIKIKEKYLKNKLASSLFTKFKQGFESLENKYPNNPQVATFKKSIKVNKFKKLFFQYWIIIVPIFLFILFVILAETERFIRHLN